MDSYRRTRLEGPVDVKKTRALGLGWVLVSSAVALLAVLLPPTDLYGGSQEAAAVVHLVLEFSSLVMACLVVFMAWSGLSRASSAVANALIFGSSLIVGADLLHALSYEAMPEWLYPVSTSTAIYFWLTGRAVQVLTLLFITLRVNLPGPKLLWLGAAAIGTFLLAIGGATHDQWLPQTYLPVTGFTDFKASIEYALTVAAWILAITLYRKFVKSADTKDFWLALGAYFMGLTELSLTVYTAPSELSALVGHILKLASYACLYKAVFIGGFEAPFTRLLKSESAIKEREQELQRILENIPACVARIDRNMMFRYANTEFINTMVPNQVGIEGHILDEVVSGSCSSILKPKLAVAMGGEKASLEFKAHGVDGSIKHLHAVIAPAKTEAGEVDGALAIFTDISAREEALRKLGESNQEVAELKAALDAHAIVAVTDARGVIMRVNDKFCQISQYRRSELIGETHRIINSGFHPKTFFADLWRTISRGEVWSGEICNRAKDGSLYWVHTTIVPFMGTDGVPVQYIAIRADITKRKEAEEQAQRMALHDVLTGLPNRRLMGDRLLQALNTVKREREYAALLLLDMDHFKDVNDTLGHAAGDDLLRQIAGRLVSNVRQNDTVARLGGDEFVVILERLDSSLVDATTKAVDLAEKIREELCATYYVGGNSVNTSPSIGVVIVGGSDQDTEELVKHADMALYKAKEEGRNKIAFFDPGLQAEITERAQLLKELRHALQRNEFRLYYQPVVNTSREIQGVECLIRWQHPSRGLVPPNLFIPLAEQSNLILPIGEWVLRQACQQLVMWVGDPVRGKWTIAVNVSAKQFHDDGFVSQVGEIINETGAPSKQLKLELTESMLHKDIELTIEKMNELRALEVRFALDDFGTGYSSLSYLKALPLHQLKIDKSFVQDVLTDESDAAIARTILSLADNLGLDVVAEGVETNGQMQFLIDSGCVGFQGYLFGKPVPVHQLRDHVPGAMESQITLKNGT